MYSESGQQSIKKETAIVYITIVIIVVLMLCPSFFHMRALASALPVLLLSLGSLFVSFYLYRKVVGWKVLTVGFLGFLVVALDGAVTNCYWRFFISTSVLFTLGMLMRNSTKPRLSLVQVFLILFAPSLLLSAPFVNLSTGEAVEFYPVAFTSYLALLLLLVFYRTENKKMIAIIGFVIIGALAFVGYPNYFSFLNGKEITTQTNPPDKRIDLPLLQSNGQQTSIREIGSKITVLDVWFTGCGVCYEKFPKLQKLSDHYLSDTDVYIATLNLPLEKEITASTAFDAVKQYHFNKLKSPASITNNLWEISQFPTLLIFDKQHRLRYSGNLEVDNVTVINNTYDIIEKLKAE